MRIRIASLYLGLAFLPACGDNPTRATPQRLTVTVTPNPLAAPSAPGTEMLWNSQLSATGTGSILLERSYAQLLDASGTRVGQSMQLWSRSAGCTSCSTDVRIADGQSESYMGQRIRYVGGGTPVRFVYTLSFVDDLGPGSTSVEVAVR